jgi:hypothetical protein
MQVVYYGEQAANHVHRATAARAFAPKAIFSPSVPDRSAARRALRFFTGRRGTAMQQEPKTATPGGFVEKLRQWWAKITHRT